MDRPDAALVHANEVGTVNDNTSTGRRKRSKRTVIRAAHRPFGRKDAKTVAGGPSNFERQVGKCAPQSPRVLADCVTDECGGRSRIDVRAAVREGGDDRGRIARDPGIEVTLDDSFAVHRAQYALAPAQNPSDALRIDFGSCGANSTAML